jgi:hypothetical protein
VFALRVILTINTSRWELPLYRERRDPLLFALRVILTNNKSQIKMEVASLSREAGTFLVLALKAARGISCLSEEATPIADYVLSLLSTCDTPIPPDRFYNFSKKRGTLTSLSHVSKVCAVLGLSSI